MKIAHLYFISSLRQQIFDPATGIWSDFSGTRPNPSGTTFTYNTQWGVVRGVVYAILEDSRLYAADQSAGGALTWRPSPLISGFNVGLLISPDGNALCGALGKLYIVGVNKVLGIYDPKTDSIGTRSIPSALGAYNEVFAAWDGSDTIYIGLSYTVDNGTEFWAYSVSAGTFTAKPAPPTPLRPGSGLWQNGKLWSLNEVGTLQSYNPATNTWDYSVASTFAFGGLMALYDLVSKIAIVHYFAGILYHKIFDTVTHTFTDLPSPALPTGSAGGRGFFSLTDAPVPMVLDPWIILVDVEIPKRVASTPVAQSSWAVARTTDRDAVRLSYHGIIVQDTPDLLRTYMTALRSSLAGLVAVEVFPDRMISGYLADWNVTPRWPGMSDRMVELTFTLECPTPYWIDEDTLLQTAMP